MTERERPVLANAMATTRRRFLEAGPITGAIGLGMLGASRGGTARAAGLGANKTCQESIPEILNTALTAERLATTLYFAALTAHAVLRNPRVAGSSANPNAVGSDGNPENVAYLQAALDQEQKHAQLLASAGAVSPYTRFHFPATTFTALGSTREYGTFLWAVDHLETAFISAYVAAVKQFSTLGRPDLALLASRLLAVECTHRALYRVIAGDDPADNVTLEVAEFACVADAATALTSFLTGRGFSTRARVTIALPTPAQTARVVGQNTSR